VTIRNCDNEILRRNSFITEWTNNADNVAGLVAAGRARWTIENKVNSVLKAKGSHLEDNFSHGKDSGHAS